LVLESVEEIRPASEAESGHPLPPVLQEAGVVEE
jgi:hypothetical protein